MGGRIQTPGRSRAAGVVAALAGVAIAYGVLVVMPPAALVLVLVLVVLLVIRRRQAPQPFLMPFTIGFAAMLVLYGVLAVIAIVSSDPSAGSGST